MLLMSREQIAMAKEGGIPVRVQNPHSVTVVMRPNPDKEDGVLTWDGVQADGNVSSQLVDPEWLSHPRMVQAIATGLLQPVMDDDPYEALASGELQPFVDPATAGQELLSTVKRSSADRLASTRKCIAPSDRGEQCGAPAMLLKGSDPNTTPPLCTGHSGEAHKYAPRATGRLLGDGSNEVGWYRV